MFVIVCEAWRRSLASSTPCRTKARLPTACAQARRGSSVDKIPIPPSAAAALVQSGPQFKRKGAGGDLAIAGPRTKYLSIGRFRGLKDAPHNWGFIDLPQWVAIFQALRASGRLSEAIRPKKERPPDQGALLGTSGSAIEADQAA
jgi:hypothetical protein